MASRTCRSGREASIATIFGLTGRAEKRVRRALGFEPETPVIGHVSRIAAEKNVDYLGAASEARARRPVPAAGP